MKRCAVRVGRIIEHACGRRAAGTCSECGNAACAHHIEGRRCVVCAGTWAAPTAKLRLEDLDMDAHFGDVDAAFADRASVPDRDLHGLDS